MSIDDLYQLWMASNKLRAVVIVFGSVGGGVLTSLLFRRVILRLARRTQTELDDIVSAHLRRPLAISVAGAGIYYAATHTLAISAPAPRIIQGLVGTVVLGFWCVSTVRILEDVLGWLVGNRERYGSFVSDRTVPVFDVAGQFLIYGLTAYFLFIAWGIDPTAWLASAGIAGVAIGFAAKDTLANLVAGVFILAEAPYKLGDYLTLDSGEMGRVTEISWRTTKLMTNDDIELILPNAIMGNTMITNQSGGPDARARIRMELSVAYGTELDEVREVLRDIAFGEPLAMDYPSPLVRMTGLGDNGVNFELQVWILEPRRHAEVTDALYTQIYKRFSERDIEIPFAQHDIHMHNEA
jgi:MscS family membrane protein